MTDYNREMIRQASDKINEQILGAVCEADPRLHPGYDVTNLYCLSSSRLISYSVHKNKSNYQGAGEDGHYVC